jgi:hypothetical protein
MLGCSPVRPAKEVLRGTAIMLPDSLSGPPPVPESCWRLIGIADIGAPRLHWRLIKVHGQHLDVLHSLRIAKNRLGWLI